MNANEICKQNNDNEHVQYRPAALANSVDSIRFNLTNDWNILSSIYDLLVDEKAFCVASQEWSEKIVLFEQPKELEVFHVFIATQFGNTLITCLHLS